MGIKTENVNTFDQLIGGADPAPLQKNLTLLTGQGILKRGSVLGIGTTDGKARLVNSSASDGSQTAKYILSEDTDTTDSDVIAPAYQAGMFNVEYLTFGGEDTIAQHETSLRLEGIYITSEKYFKTPQEG